MQQDSNRKEQYTSVGAAAEEPFVRNYLLRFDSLSQQMLETSNVCALILDAAGRFLYINSHYQREMEIETFDAYRNREWLSLWEGEERKKVEKSLEIARSGRVGTFQTTCCTAKGTPKWWEILILPFLNTSGQLLHLLIIQHDHTEQRHLLENAINEREWFQQILQHLPSGLLIAEPPDGRIFLGNRQVEEILRHPILYSSEIERYREWKGWRLDGQAVKPDEWPLARAIKGETSVEEVRYLRGDGSFCFIRVRGAPLKDAQGEVIAGMVTFDDISEQKELERRQQAFLSLVTHELKGPLTALQGSIQLLQRRLHKIEESANQSIEETQALIEGVQSLLTRCQQQTRLQNRLINDLLDMSRLQSEKMALHLQTCDIVNMVEEVVLDQQQASPRRQIWLQQAEVGPVLVRIDRDRMGQVMNNYMTNALKYSPVDQPVYVGLEKEAGQVRFWVRDFGPGLSSEEQQHIWELYYQVPGIAVQGTEGSGIGLGLGLYICQQLVTRHEGRLGVESKPGQGSLFWFTLPLAD